MSDDAVHTSAPADEPDMFEGTSADPAAFMDLMLRIEGELIESARVCIKLIGDDQHPVPVLCMDVKPLNGFKRTIHAEQIFSESTRKLAEQKAATLKKGARITLTTSLHDMRTILPHVLSVALSPQEH
jgi:hypothetical protein